jgi:hypothetical protein
MPHFALPLGFFYHDKKLLVVSQEWQYLYYHIIMYVNPCDCYNPDQIVLLLSWYNVLGLGLWCLTSLSVLLVEETGVPGQVTDKLTFLLYIILCCIKYILPWTGFELTTLVMIGTDCTGNCKSSYHTIMTTTGSVNCSLLCGLHCILIIETTEPI